MTETAQAIVDASRAIDKAIDLLRNERKAPHWLPVFMSLAEAYAAVSHALQDYPARKKKPCES